MYRIKIKNGDTETVIHSPTFDGPKVLSGSIKSGINVADNFTFGILPNNPGYDELEPLRTLVSIENMKTGNFDFEGFIFMPAESMDDSGEFGKSFTAVSELGFLTQSSQRHGEYHEVTVREFLQIIIDNHNLDVWDDPIDKQFVLGEVNVESSTGTLYRYLGYEDTLSTIKDKLLDRLGGELQVRKENGVRYLDYLKEIGSHEDSEIRLAKNLQSITKEVDPTEIITRLIPLGERLESEDESAADASEARLTIESVNNGKDYIVDEEAEESLGTIVVKSETWDDITQPGILKSRGLEFLQEQNKLKVQYSISALDLHLLGKAPSNFEVGSWYPVYNPVMNINERLRIVAKTIDIIEPEDNNLTIGNKLITASEYQADSNRRMKEFRNFESQLQSLGELNTRLSQSLRSAREDLEIIQGSLTEIDVENLPEELHGIAQQLAALQLSIGDISSSIPNYGLANSTTDGLLSARLYMKLVAIDMANELRDGLMAKEDKAKLNKIMVTEPVDLGELINRIQTLENIERTN